RLHRLRRIRLAAYQHRIAVNAVFRHPQIDTLGIGGIEIRAARIANDANNRINRSVSDELATIVRLLIGRAQADGWSDRVVPRPQLSCCRFTEDDRKIISPRSDLERTAEHQRNAERLKIVRLNVTILKNRLRVSRRGSCAVNWQDGCVEATVPRRSSTGEMD